LRILVKIAPLRIAYRHSRLQKTEREGLLQQAVVQYSCTQQHIDGVSTQ